jgi:hypothetical protein
MSINDCGEYSWVQMLNKQPTDPAFTAPLKDWRMYQPTPHFLQLWSEQGSGAQKTSRNLQALTSLESWKMLKRYCNYN